MSTEKIKALALELEKDIKNPDNLSTLTAQLTKITVEAALGAQLEVHYGYAPNQVRTIDDDNSRNGFTIKTLKGDHGDIVINTPRDRDGRFEPQRVRKRQTVINGIDEQILCLYAKGMSTRDIVGAFSEMYGAKVSAGLISKVTNTVIDEVVEWQARSLDAVYPMVYMGFYD